MATDNCDTDITITFSDVTVPGSCPQNFTIVRTWTAEDDCGNIAQASASYVVSDDTDPVLTIASDVIIECNAAVPAPSWSATDNCGMVTGSVSEVTEPGACENSFTILRTYTVSDECGNTTSQTQTITVQDTTDPVFSGSPAIELPCDNSDGIYVTATDNCDSSVTIEIVNNEFSTIGCQGSIIRTYQATDNCGNSAVFSQTITLVDTSAPVLQSATPNFEVECGAAYTDPTAVFTDNCDTDLTYLTTMTSSTDGCSTTITYTITATDNCNNSASHNVVVTIVDTTNPVFDFLPANETYECDETIPAPTIPGATDNCDTDVTVSFTETVTPGDCPQEYSILRVIRAFDNCGNQAIWAVTITITDTTAPEFAVQQNTFNYECNTAVPVIEPTVADNCGAVTLTFADVVNVTGDCEGSTVRTWTATDECGNSSSFVQTFLIQDTTDPVIAGIASIDRPCGDFSGIYVTATDNCDTNVQIGIVSDLATSGGCQGGIIRTYVATDNCGNTSQFVQFITLTDNVLPVLASATANFTVECDQAFDIPTATFTDNCDDVLAYETTVSSSTDGCTTTLTYTITATDNCDNAASHNVIVTVVDTTDPVITAPAGGSFSCDVAIDYGVATAADNCDTDLTITFQDVTTPGSCPQNFTVVRTWSATDNCGNVGQATSTYQVLDTTPPVLTIPSDTTIECDAMIPAGSWSATDNCGAVSGNFVEVTVPGVCENSFSILRTYTVSDECGNTTSQTQTITLLDTTDPVITGPLEIQLPCDNVTGIFVTAADNCDGDVLIEIVSDQLVSGGCQGRYIRTYRATDNCGNDSEFIQDIELIDDEAPMLVSATASFTVECDETFDTPTAIFSDNCDDNLEISTLVLTSSDGCTTTITYTFTATDNCDNMMSHDVVVTVVDTTDPVITVPAGGNFSCDSDIEFGWAMATDNCDTDITITFSDVTVPGS
ncbi:MAG: hypothetical protein ACK54P_01000, partial [Bacteroidota bacterium]